MDDSLDFKNRNIPGRDRLNDVSRFDDIRDSALNLLCYLKRKSI